MLKPFLLIVCTYLFYYYINCVNEQMPVNIYSKKINFTESLILILNIRSFIKCNIVIIFILIKLCINIWSVQLFFILNLSNNLCSILFDTYQMCVPGEIRVSYIPYILLGGRASPSSSL